MHVFDLQELEAATDHFSPSRLIGKGSHGLVYRGLLDDGRLIVAVKKQSLAFQNLRDNTKIENEATILSSILPPNNNNNNTNHLSIIDLIGVGLDAHGNKLLVTRHMPNGTLHDALHASPAPPTFRKRLEIALQVARGVRLLHESTPPIVHRDIKPTNILFDKTWSATLADFGLAVRLSGSRIENETRLPAGTIGYIDPNYTTPGKVSTGIDVFSYGVVLLELVSGRKAMDVNKSPPWIVEWALPLIERGRGMEVCDTRVRLTRDAASGVKQVLRVAARCLETRESARPTMGEVVGVLEKLTEVRMSMRFSAFRDIVANSMGLRKFTKSGGTCAAGGNGNNSSSSSSRISKGTLLVREILADITLN